MDRVDIINNFLRILFINYMTCFSYTKITNNKNNTPCKMIYEILLSLFTAGTYIFLVRYFHPFIVMIILYFINGICLSKVFKYKIEYSMIATIISFLITYLIYLLSTIISAILLVVARNHINIKNKIILIITCINTIILMKIIFRAKRLKNGFNFLTHTDKNSHSIKYIVLFSVITLSLFGYLHTTPSKKIIKYLLGFTILLAISLIFWIQHEITEHYKKHMKDRTIEMQKKEIDEQQKIMEEVKQENYHLASVIHKYNHRINAIEKALSKSIQTNENTEFANELAPLLEETKNISQNFTNETTIIQELPKTNIFGIDNMLSYMADEARKHNIHFDLKINDNINYLIENIISQDKFETLLGDHIKDAIIAINTSENQNKSIIVIIGKINNCYELSIYDTGVEFEIDTLLKLGEAPITTHKNEGGTGIGFMTTFATMKDTKSSLIIEEYNQKTTNYTKSITIKFDGKSEYRIYSYRAEQIDAKNKNNRIIVKEI